MEHFENILQLNKDISSKLLDSIYLLEILDDLIDGEPKEGTILSVLKQNIISSFQEISDMRRLISDID